MRNVRRGAACSIAVVVGAAGVVAVAGSLGAQTAPPVADPHRHAIALSVDAGSYPDAFSTRCGQQNNGGAGFGAGIGLITRPRHHLMLEGEVRGSMMPVGFGCDLPLLVVPVDSNVYETRPGFSYPTGTPSLPLLRSLMRIGIEGPSAGPLLHATVGAGVIWSGHPAPLGSIAIGAGSRGPGARFYVELERDVSRLRATEIRNRFRADSAGEIPLGTFNVVRVLHPAWTTLHLGLELPMTSHPAR